MSSLFFLRLCLFICLFVCLFVYRQSRRVGEREGEIHQCVVASFVHPSGDSSATQACALDWESKQQRFGSQISTQSTEPHQPGLCVIFKKHRICCLELKKKMWGGTRKEISPNSERFSVL